MEGEAVLVPPPDALVADCAPRPVQLTFGGDDVSDARAAADTTPRRGTVSAAPRQATPLLKRACRVLGADAAEMSERLENPWAALFIIHGLMLVQLVLLVAVWGWGTSWALLYLVPVAASCAVLPLAAVWNSSKSLEVLQRDKTSALLSLVSSLCVMVCFVVPAWERLDRVPMKSQVVYTLAAFLLLFLGLVRGGVMVPQMKVPRDMPCWRMAIAASLPTAAMINALTNIEVASGLMYALVDRKCSWHGRNDCAKYRLCFIVTVVAAAVNYGVSAAPVLVTNLQANQVLRLVFGCVVLAANVVLFAVAIVLGNACTDREQAAHQAVLQRYSQTGIFWLSAALTLVAFLMELTAVQVLARRMFVTASNALATRILNARKRFVANVHPENGGLGAGKVVSACDVCAWEPGGAAPGCSGHTEGGDKFSLSAVWGGKM